jgi:hypothetical protein
MSEYARPTNTTNPVLDPVVYWRVSAFALTAVALLGIVLNATGNGNLFATGATHNHLLPFTWTHDIIHVVLALAAFIFGYAALPGRVVKAFAILFGVVYAGLGILGFVTTNPLGTGSLSLNLTETLNAVHLLLGGWALVAGVAAKYDGMGTTAN